MGKIRLPNLFAESLVRVSDWNGDGVPDLLTRNLTKIVVALGPFSDRGAIALAHEIEIDSERKGPTIDFAIADWNRDGKPDLLVLQKHQYRAGGIYWYKNLGGPGMTKLAEGKLLLEIPADMHVQGFCVGDWNGDGWPDLIVTREESIGKNAIGSHVGWRTSAWLYLRELR